MAREVFCTARSSADDVIGREDKRAAVCIEAAASTLMEGIVLVLRSVNGRLRVVTCVLSVL